MNIKFISDDKDLKDRMTTIFIRFVFDEDGNLYPQVF